MNIKGATSERIEQSKLKAKVEGEKAPRSRVQTRIRKARKAVQAPGSEGKGMMADEENVSLFLCLWKNNAIQFLRESVMKVPLAAKTSGQGWNRRVAPFQAVV